MAEKKKKRKSESTKRFGPRYGRRLKEKVAEIEKGHRGRHKCPFCNKKSVKRIAVGIWLCKSCNAKFAGKAYSMGKIVSTSDANLNVDNVKPIKKAEEELVLESAE